MFFLDTQCLAQYAFACNELLRCCLFGTDHCSLLPDGCSLLPFVDYLSALFGVGKLVLLCLISALAYTFGCSNLDLL